MKARLKETGDIIEVEKIGTASGMWALQSDSAVVFYNEDLDINIEPDYWEKLKHQYAGMAMQGILSNNTLLHFLCKGRDGEPINDVVANNANTMATALVNKLKEKEND